MTALDGSCRTPIGALARVNGGEMSFIGETLTPDGTKRWRREDDDCAWATIAIATAQRAWRRDSATKFATKPAMRIVMDT